MRLVLVVSLLIGCSNDLPPRGDGGLDGGADASIDGSFPDGALDGGIDAGSDAGPVTCGEPGCGWCASRGRCLSATESCAFEGDCDAFDACATATCWDPDLVVGCADRRIPEDFASGRYNVHAYAATLPAGAPITIDLEQITGMLEPAIFIADGALLYGGDPETLDPRVRILMSESGRGGSYASVTLQTTEALSVLVLVTGWSVVDSGFTAFLDTDVSYELRVRQECEGSDSESVGSPNAGSLLNGVRINDGPGYVVADTGRDAYYGTQETVDLIRAAFAHVVEQHPSAQVVQVRDISVLGGGEPSGPWPHSSHQSGRDVDMTYHLDSCSPATGCPLADVPLALFDAEATWTLFKFWIDLGVLTYIFVDSRLQEVLHGVASARGATPAQLDAWIQWPRAAGTSSAIIRHVANHLNHHHVRFTCPADDARCVE